MPLYHMLAINIYHSMSFLLVFQLMGCGVAGPSGLNAVQHVGLEHNSEGGSVSFQLEFHMDKTALV